MDARLSTITGLGETSDNVRTVLLMESKVKASDNVVWKELASVLASTLVSP